MIIEVRKIFESTEPVYLLRIDGVEQKIRKLGTREQAIKSLKTLISKLKK